MFSAAFPGLRKLTAVINVFPKGYLPVMSFLKRVPLLLVLSAAVPALVYQLFIGPVTALLPFSAADAVSKATTIIDAPSGSFVVLLNEKKHEARQTADDWEAFFRGESPLLMEDIVCDVIQSDPSGYEMADSYRSRLPENQMTIRQGEALLVVSRAEQGLCDVVVMSKETADSWKIPQPGKGSGLRMIEVSK